MCLCRSCCWYWCFLVIFWVLVVVLLVVLVVVFGYWCWCWGWFSLFVFFGAVASLDVSPHRAGVGCVYPRASYGPLFWCSRPTFPSPPMSSFPSCQTPTCLRSRTVDSCMSLTFVRFCDLQHRIYMRPRLEQHDLFIQVNGGGGGRRSRAVEPVRKMLRCVVRFVIGVCVVWLDVVGFL